MKLKEKSKNGKEFTKDTLRNGEKIIIINDVRRIPPDFFPYNRANNKPKGVPI